MNRSRTLTIASAALVPLVAAGTFAVARASEHTAGSPDVSSSQGQAQQPSFWPQSGTGGLDGSGGGGFSEPGRATGTTTSATEDQSRGVVLITTSVDFGRGAAAGTGLVIGADGIVVTNHHVIAGATSISVTDPSTGTTYTATVVGYDSTHDVAVLRLQGASGLTTITTDTTATTGETVTAVGNAAGQARLVAAAGSILGTGVGIDVTEEDGGTAHLSNLIEDSSDVVQGDSGGALLDAENEVVGMNVAASTGTTDVTGYAIPIATVTSVAQQILAGQASSTVTIGTTAGLGVAVASNNGAYVEGVVSGGAAEASGITAGDTITGLGPESIATADALTADLRSLRAGDVTTITWRDRSGTTHRASVTLGSGPVA